MISEELRVAIRESVGIQGPLASYVVDEQGVVLFANEEFQKIFGSDVVGRNMREFYRDPADRDALDEKLTKVLESEILHLIDKNNEDCIALDFTWRLFDDDGQQIGMKCCLLDVTKKERARQVFENVPAGIYLIDQNGVLIFGNDQLARMHGYETFDEIEGKHVSSFFFDQSEGAALERKIIDKGSVENEKIQLLRKDDTRFWGSVTSRAMHDTTGKYSGREGVILDVTREEEYRQIIEGLPLGLFRVRCEDGGSREIIDHYNKKFEEIAGYPEGELLGQPISILHAEDFDFQRRLEQLHADPSEDQLDRVPVRITTHSGDRKLVEVTTRVIRDKQGRPLHRVGAGHDISDQEQLKRWERLIREDFGNFLHTLTSNLMALTHTLENARGPCGDDPFEDPSTATLSRDLAVVEEAARDLRDKLAELMSLRKAERAGGALSEENWQSMEQSFAFLSQEDHLLSPGVRHSILQEVGSSILANLEEWEHGFTKRGFEKQMRASAQRLTNYSTLLALHLASARLVEMDSEVQRLREVVITANLPSEARKAFLLGSIVRTVIADLADYAQRQRVEVRTTFPSGLENQVVSVEYSAVRRAIGNLLHNAIKYSWHRPEGVFATLELIREHGRVGIKITSFGVPVARDELEKVFEVGFRGRFAGDLRRRGTGLGLWDARRVAREHGGEVDLTSRPAVGASEDLRRPFLTTVRFLILPDSMSLQE